MKWKEWTISFVAPLAVLLVLSAWLLNEKTAPNSAQIEAEPFVAREMPTLTLPILLSANDSTLYQEIFRAQKKGDFATADSKIPQLSNKLLLGEVLAERYLNNSYTATSEELFKWLTRYSDHPQAYDIYTLAQAKNIGTKTAVPSISKPAMLQGYGDDNGLGSKADDAFPTQTWRTALNEWRAGRKAEASRLFTAIANHSENFSPWQSSAAAYWAWRSNHAVGNRAQADKFLRSAASHPRSFYGILARNQLGVSLGLDDEPLTLSESDILEMIGEPPVRRTIALAQSNLVEVAEKELRVLFPKADAKEKRRLLALAYHFNLASVQISMAKHLDTEKQPMDYAKYPIPHWKPQDGFKIEPALIYALMRQESGFKPSAASSSGALGLMQLMPKTASLMHRQINNDLRDSGLPQMNGSVIEPGFNIALGQNYIQHLLENNLVDGNLFYMLTAYNAGPGRLQEWKQTIEYRNDPLLFVESIPYAQTRHYVMQVMTNYWIYSELAGNRNHSIYALLNGRWPSYDGGVFTQNAG